MPRTKGAKGKKTIAKEMGMTLEQYEKYLLGKEIIKQGFKEINEGTKEEKERIDKVIQPSALKQPKIIIKEQNTDEKLKEVKDLIAKKSRKEKELPKCQRCHCEIQGSSPFRINLISLTTKASYHRQTEDDHEMVLLCDDCINKLNKLVDKFLYDDGNGVPLKYGATEFLE